MSVKDRGSELERLAKNAQALASTLREASARLREASEAEPKRAFVAPSPCAASIWRGEAKLVVKADSFRVEGESLYLADQEKLYGVVCLGKARPISLAEFRRRQKEHGIPDEVRRELWPKSRRLYAYTVESFTGFEEPQAWKQAAAAPPAPEPRYKRDPKDDELKDFGQREKDLLGNVVMWADLFSRQIGPVVDQAIRLMELSGAMRSLLLGLKTLGPALEEEYAKLLARLGTKKAESREANPFISAEKLLGLLRKTRTFLPKRTRILALSEDAITQLEAFLKLEAQFREGQKVSSTVGKASADGFYELDEQGNFVDLQETDLYLEEKAERPRGKLPVLKMPDPAFNLGRLRGKKPTGVVSRLERTARAGQRQFLVNEVAPTKADAAYIWGVVVLGEAQELEDLSKLSEELRGGLDKFTLEEYSTESPVYYLPMKLVAAYDPPLKLKRPPAGRRYGPAISLPEALAKTVGYPDPESGGKGYCPACDKEIEQDAGEPGSELVCPHCGTKLVRKDATTITTGDVPLMHPRQVPPVPGSLDSIMAKGGFCYCPACGEVMELKEGESCEGKVCPSCDTRMASMGQAAPTSTEKAAGKESYVCPKCGQKSVLPADRKGSGRVCSKCGTQMVREQKRLMKQDEQPWMSFRGLTPETVKELEDRDLRELYELADDLLKGPFAESTTLDGLTKEDVVNAMHFIIAEMKSRGLPLPGQAPAIKAGPSDRYAPIEPGSEGEKPPLKLDELLPYFHKEFLLRAPAVYLVGSIVNKGETCNDVDVLVKGPIDETTAHILKFRLGRMLPADISARLQFHGCDGEDISKAGPFTAHTALYDLVVRRRDDFASIIEMRDSGLEPEHLGFFDQLAKQDPFLKLPTSEKPVPSVLHQHFRGRTVHADFRIKANDHLIGYTMAHQIAGRVPLMENLEGAKRFAAGFDAQGSRWNKSFVAPARIFASTKAPEPLPWLGVDSEEFEAGTVGATRFNRGYMVAIARPRCSYGSRTPVFHEYFLEKEPKFQGLLTFRLLVGRGGEEGDEEAGRRTPEGQAFWVAMFSKSLLPSVVRRRAVNVGRIGPQGWAYLPPGLKSVVPKRFRYWLPSDEKERLEIRDALVEERFFTEDNVKMVDGEFRRVMTKYYLYEPPLEDREEEEPKLENKGSPSELVEFLQARTAELAKAVQDLKMRRLEKARHRRDECMQCKATPTYECVWAGGRARAWFCSKHFHAFKDVKGNEVIRWRRIKGGEVGKKYGEAPLDSDKPGPAYWDPHNPNPKVGAGPGHKKKPGCKKMEEVRAELAKGLKPNAVVTVSCYGDMAKALVRLLEAIKAHCDWGASRSWKVDDPDIAKDLERRGYASSVGFDGDGADKIVDIKMVPALAKALHDELAKQAAGSAPFTLAWQRWKGQIVIRAAPSRQVFHLYIKRPNGVEDFQILADPTKAPKAGVIRRLITGKEASKLMSFEGAAPPKKKVGGIVLNPTKDTPSTVSILARGVLSFLQDDRTFKKFKLVGKGLPKELQGLFVLRAEEGTQDTWFFERSAGPGGPIPSRKDEGETEPAGRSHRHTHEYEVDGQGDGETTKTLGRADKHTHAIEDWEVKPAMGHAHDKPGGHTHEIVKGDVDSIAYSVQRPPTAVQSIQTGPVRQEKRLTPAQQADFDRETAQIRENQKKPEAQRRHKFRSAKWTHPNGHPRCLLCGAEERTGGYCDGRSGTKKGVFETHTAEVEEHSHRAYVDEFTGNGLTSTELGHAHDVIHWVVQGEMGHTHDLGLIHGALKKGFFETHTTEEQDHSHRVYVDEFAGNGETSEDEGHYHTILQWRVEASAGHTHGVGLIPGIGGAQSRLAKGIVETHTGESEGHSHFAYVDEFTGKGMTSFDLGHKHLLENWQVLSAGTEGLPAHTHTMGLLPGKPTGPAETEQTSGPLAKKEQLKTVTIEGKPYADMQVWDPKYIKPGDDKTHDRERLRPLALYKPMKVAPRPGNEFRSSEMDRLYKDFATSRMLDVGLAVEPKWNGFRASVQKDSGGRVLVITEEVFDRKTDLVNLAEHMPGLKKEVASLPGPFILDAEFTAIDEGGGPVPRRELAEFRGKGTIEDKNVRLRVFDVLYHPKLGNVVARPYRERRQLLQRMLAGRDLSRVVLSPFRLAKSKPALTQAISWARKVAGSEGAMLKSLEHTVTLRENDLMAKLKAIREFRGIIWDRHPVKDSPGVYNFFYAVGPVSAGEAESWAETVEVKDKLYIKAGRTFNSKLAANVGDVLRIEVTEILYDESNPAKKRLRGFTPVVIDEVSGGPSSVKEVLALLDPGEIKKSAEEIQEAVAKSVGLGDWRFVAKQQKEEERYVLGVVLVPDEYDSQGDIYDEETVRKASEYFMEHAKTLGLMHETALSEKKIKILENYIAPCDLTIEGSRVKKGTWLLAARVLDDELWQAVKNGQLTGWSIEGSALAQHLS